MFHLIAKIALLIYRFCLRILPPYVYKEYQNDYKSELTRFKNYSEGNESHCDYLDKKECFKLWEDYITKNFDKNNSQSFYEGWNGMVGLLAVAVNIHDQFRRYELYQQIRKNVKQSDRVLDIGCGSASLYWNYLRENQLVLIDLPNENQEYVKFKAKDYKKIKVGTEDTLNASNKYDVIFLIDVLEHLEEPSQFFMQKVDPYLKEGGLLFVQAPWGGIPEHLPQAPIDWEKQGAKILKKNYKKIAAINHLFDTTGYYLSGVYKKLAN